MISTGEADPSIAVGSGGIQETLSRTAENYTRVMGDETVNFPLYLRNTLVVAILSVLGTTLTSAVCAYV